MPYFYYKVLDLNNQSMSGTIQAASEKIAAEILGDQGFTILVLKEEKRGILIVPLKIFNRIKPRDIVIFSRQLAVMVSATVPLVQGLKILIKQTSNSALKTIVSEIADDVEGGAKLSVALGRHPDVFDKFYINIVKSGEVSGKLDEILNYLADQKEKDYDLMAKIKGAMIYPIFVLGGLFVVGSAMVIFVVPNLTSILVESGADLPLSTKILIGVSNFLSHYWWLLLFLILGIIVGLKLLLRIDFARRSWDLLKLKIPIFGNLFQKIILIRFSRSLETLIVGGVPLGKSLDIVSEVVDNIIYQELILETAKEIESGNPLATVFVKSDAVPPMVSQMLNVGEKTGRVDEILKKLADFYTREVDNLVANLMVLLEPFIMIFMGVAVGLLVASIILPMYNLAGSL